MDSEKKGPVNACLVCGFLGAGKTTFIKGRLNGSHGKSAVLVNEFGKLGLDGEEIERSGPLKVIEMPGGCICCSQSENLADTVADLVRQVRPDRLLIEPSGVAEASSVIKTLTKGPCSKYIRLESVVTLVDATTFLSDIQPGAFGGFFMDQLVNADTILINKIDLVSLKTIDEIKAEILRINESALVFPVCFGAHDLILSKTSRSSLKESVYVSRKIDSMSVRLLSALGDEQLKIFETRLKAGEFGEILRVKGIFKHADGKKRMLQYARGEVVLEDSTSGLCERMTIIGLSIHREQLENFLQPKTRIKKIRTKL